MTKSNARPRKRVLRAALLLGAVGIGLSGCVYGGPDYGGPGPYAYQSPPAYYYAPRPYYYGPSVSLDFRAGHEHFRDRH